jgi:hypothetical protein
LVDLVVLQTASYLIAALSFAVTCAYYIINLKEGTKNRRIALTNSLMLPQFLTEQGVKQLIDLMNLDWKDFNDFQAKYDSQINPEVAAKRIAVWQVFDNIGYQYRIGALDADTVFSVCSIHATNMWLKFKPIIEEYRKSDYGKDTFSDFEYLAGEMAKIKSKRDELWKGARSYIRPEDYDSTFKK